ncbi:CRISPR-associated endonuclease Cas2 [Pontibacter sp. G13]|uniref:CRISPR-associated endonuclease Cas2 n=1 Tax=Pontibacter sp. G13 TaxID=3074898 RepID=UPI002889E640|nr:CRISPR-associated endonuclease Cas2 [Pontibacter sp. G13]WNJ20038.1 CRISPR-associated endonuclease Cas2 [Pontibacter sp. G13]
MYVILVYDVSEKRVAKMLKLCRRYLNWIQNSVLEGELTQSGLRAMESEIKELIDPSTDSVIMFKSRDSRWLEKRIWGIEKGLTDVFL